MKKFVVFLFITMLTAMLSGCVISKTPNTNDVSLPSGEQMTFSVTVLPIPATYAWTLDGAPLTGTEKSYEYIAMGGEHILEVQATHALGTDTQTWNIYGNSHPVANAGADQSADVGAMIILDGSGSTDSDNDIVSYQWLQTGGPTVTLINADAAVAQFSAAVAEESVLTFELTVRDAVGLTSTDTCVVTVSKSNDLIFGMYWDGAQEHFISIDIENEEINDISTIPGFTNLFGNSAFDSTNSYYIASSNLGITFIDSLNGSLIKTIPDNHGIVGLTYDKTSMKLFGIYWSGTQEHFVSIDIENEEVNDISTIPGFTNRFGNSTFDPENGYYITSSNLGITVIDSQDGSLVKAISDDHLIGGLAYDTTSKKLFGMYWNGTQEHFVSIDIDNEEINDVSIITGFTGWSRDSAFDSTNGYYITQSNLGITVIDSQNGSLVKTIPDTFWIGGLVAGY